jgi:hypothetical protein
MLRIGRLDLSPGNRTPRITQGALVHKSQLIRPDPGQAITPNAFLIEQAPHQVVAPHFHVNCQFQVFSGGSGSLGRKPLVPFVVQYVGGHTGYGPITAGPEGLLYFTLRPSEPSGARYLPECLPELDRTVPKRQITSDAFPSGSARVGAPPTEVIAPQQDGLAAWMLALGPSGSCPAPRHPKGLARYYLVTKGVLIAGDAQLGTFSIAWVNGDDLLNDVRAGPEGVELLCMQFPADAL